MANTGDIHGLFWDDENGDRTYESSSFERWLKKFFTTGVFLNDLMVSASDGMTIGVSGGYANVDGKVRFWDNTTNFTLEPANSTYPRIDTIVITRDEVERTVQLEAVKGQYSGNNPVATAPIRNTEKHQLVIAQILVSAGVTTITQADITDTRADSELCGIVACAVEKYDFGQWSAQFRAEIAQFKGENLEAFTTWFNNIKGQLSTDAAGHLQNEIDELAKSLNASAIHYNNANSDLTATDVQSAIDEVKEITDDVKADITNNVKPKVATLEEELTANGNRIYMDYKNGKYGYNTSPTRGADTFTPFRELKIVRLGKTGTSYDVKAYDGWQDFTNDNFYLRVNSISMSANNNVLPNNNINYGGIGGPSISYNKNTGIVTVGGASGSGTNDGGKLGWFISADIDVYLVYA